MKRRICFLLITLSFIASLAVLCSCSGSKNPTKMTVTQTPDSLKIVQGMDPDFTGGLVEVEFEDGSVKEIAMSDLEYKGVNVETLGEQTVVFTYSYKKRTVSTAINMTVIAPKVTAISLKSDDVKKDYVEGTAFDRTGLVVTVTYQTGATAEISSYEVSPQKLTLSTKEVKISHRGIYALIPVTVIPLAPVSAEITSLPSKSTYFIGETFLSDGTSLKVVNNDGSEEIFTADELSFYHNEGTSIYRVASEDNVVRALARAKYGDISATFTLTVRAIEPTSLTLLAPSQMNALTFTAGEVFSFYDDEAVSIRIYYNDGHTETVYGSTDYFEYSEEPLTLGQQKKTVWAIGYPSVTAQIPIIVSEPYVTGISIETIPTDVEYDMGEDIDLTGLRLRLYMSKGPDQFLDYSAGCGITCSPDKAMNTPIIEVYYQGFSDFFGIAINAE